MKRKEYYFQGKESYKTEKNAERGYRKHIEMLSQKKDTIYKGTTVLPSGRFTYVYSRLMLVEI